MKRGQLYRVPATKIDPKHDPSGDCVYEGSKQGDVIGFVIRRDEDNTLLIVLFRPHNLPDKVDMILEYCDAVQVLREEARVNPVLEKKLNKIKSFYTEE